MVAGWKAIGCSSIGGDGLHSLLDSHAELGDGNGLGDTVGHTDLAVELALLLGVRGGNSDDGHFHVLLEDRVFRVRVVVADRGCGLNTREDGHINVHEDEVDLVLGELVEGGEARVLHRGELDSVGEVLVEKAGEDSQVDRVIVNDHDLDLARLLDSGCLVVVLKVTLDAHSRRGGRGDGRENRGRGGHVASTHFNQA